MATHETGVQNANVNNLILYIQTTRDLHERVEAAYKMCNADTFIETPFILLFWDAIKSYEREFPKKHLEGEDLRENQYNTTFDGPQQTEFLNYYRSLLPEWLKERENEKRN